VPLPVDPATATKIAEAGAKVAKVAWPAGVRVKDQAEAYRQLGEIIPEAVALAVCPEQPDDPAVISARGRIWARLRAAEMPGPSRKPPGWAARRMARVRRIPKVSAYAAADFFGLLEEWMIRAVNDAETRALLSRVACGERSMNATDIAARFSAGFFLILGRADDAPWRTSLLDGLRDADRKRRWLNERKDWAESVLQAGVAGGGTAIAAAAVGASPKEIAASGATAAVLAFAGRTAVERSGSRHASAIEATMQAAIMRLLDDVRAAVERSHAAGGPPPRNAGAANGAGASAVPLKVDPLLLDHMKFLRTEVQTIDPDVAAALFELEDAMLRAARTPFGHDLVIDAIRSTQFALTRGDVKSQGVV
jgi:hypothetical protein